MSTARIASPGEPRWFLGTLVHPLVSGEDTDGRFALWETVLPCGAAPPLHTHPQDETFYVLDGALTVWAEESASSCGRGDVVFVPGGVPHAFRVESETARLLFVSTPAGIDAYVADLSEPAGWPWLPPPPDGPRVPFDRLEAVERAHGVVRVGPPPTTKEER
ncbi:MAG TPA: cupin domain-containing protein [Gaiellaceae bacterium]